MHCLIINVSRVSELIRRRLISRLAKVFLLVHNEVFGARNNSRILDAFDSLGYGYASEDGVWTKSYTKSVSQNSNGMTQVEGEQTFPVTTASWYAS